jgi:hypothetical protein
MNRRALLSAFLAAPVAVRLGRWSAPKPVGPIRDLKHLTVGAGGMFTALQAALDRAAPGAIILLHAGHSEVITKPLMLPKGASLIGVNRDGSTKPQFTWNRAHG